MNTSSAPLATTHSSNRNVHVLSYRHDGSLVVAPGPFGRNMALVYIAVLPVLLYACRYYNAPPRLQLVAILFPLFAAGGHILAYMFYAKYGTRIVVETSTRKVNITGLRHGDGKAFSFDDISAIQRINAGRKGGVDGSWRAYQINAVLTDGIRCNLLDSAGVSQLDAIGDALAKALRVPFERHD